MLGSAPSVPSVLVSPSVKLSVAGRGGARSGSCVLIHDLVVMAKVGASGSGVLLLLIVENITTVWAQKKKEVYTASGVRENVSTACFIRYRIIHIFASRLTKRSRTEQYLKVERKHTVLDLELNKMLRLRGSKRINFGLKAPPLSPAYVPDPMELDEHVPVYVPELEHPEYHVPTDDDIQVEDQPYADDASPTAKSLGHIADLMSMEEEEDHSDDPADGEDGDDEPSDDDDDDDDTDDEDEEPTVDEQEKEHIALADSAAVPVVDPVPSAGDTKAFITSN
ncbi:hypothetical protein Tco_1142892 [Tanacetum coccineum]